MKTSRVAAVSVAVVLAVLQARAEPRYYIAYSFAAVLPLWLTTRPPRIRFTYVAAVIVALWGVRFFVGAPNSPAADPAVERVIESTLGFAGAGSLIVLALFPPAAPRLVGEIEMLGAYVIGGFGLFADRWFRYMTAHPLASLDRVLFAVDQKLGVQLGFITGRAFGHWPLLAVASATAYRMLPVTMAWLFVSLPRRPVRPRVTFIAAAAVAGTFGYLSYRLCPAAGPKYAFPAAFPYRIPAIAPGFVHPVDMPSSLLNAFPSLHAVWVLLIFMWSGALSFTRRAGIGVVLALTLLATLGLGEHYAVDLAVAVPFAIAVEALCTVRAGRLRACLLCVVVSAGIFGAWVEAVRAGAVVDLSPSAARVLVAITIVLPLVLRAAYRARAASVDPEAARIGRDSLNAAIDHAVGGGESRLRGSVPGAFATRKTPD